MADVCAVCGKPDCNYPARDRDGLTVFEFEQAAQSITREQLAMLRSDHAYEQRAGKLGTRPLAELPASIPATKFDWPLNVGMWLLLALLLAMAWFWIGCGSSNAGNILDRTETALKLLLTVFEFEQAAQSITREQLAMLRSDHAYEQRAGKLGTRPLAELPASIPATKFDWPLNVGMWLLLALLLAMAWFWIGCGSSNAGNILDRTETALKLLQCVEHALPAPVGGAAEAVATSDRAAVVTSAVPPTADAGAADSSTPRGIDTQDPWWESDGGMQ